MDERLESLRGIAVGTLRDCTQPLGGEGPLAGTRLLLPSGDRKYPAMWVQDCAMSTLCGACDAADVARYIGVVARCGINYGPERTLMHGLSVPHLAVADHINPSGRGVFFPGTYSDGDDQGQGKYGHLPMLCDNPMFVLMTAHHLLTGGDRRLLDAEAGGMPMHELLWRLLSAYCVDEETQLYATVRERRAVDWGFTDSITKWGLLLVPSLMRYEAALELGRVTGESRCAELAGRIASSVNSVLMAGDWYLSATGAGRQNDVWGTAYALALGITPGGHRRAMQAALADAYLSGDTVRDGYVRHLRKRDDFSDETAWDCAPGREKGWYQNGAYWSTPTGWVFQALYDYDRELALSFIDEFIAHSRAHSDAPYEFFCDDGRYSGARFATSAAMPYLGYLRATGAC